MVNLSISDTKSPRLESLLAFYGRRPLVKKGTLPRGIMAQISEGSQNRFEELRNEIEQSLEEMIASRVNSGEVVELAGRMLLAGGKRLRPIMMFLAYELAGGKIPMI